MESNIKVDGGQMLSLDVGVVDCSEGDDKVDAVGSVGGADEGGAGREVASDGVVAGAEEAVGTVGGADEYIWKEKNSSGMKYRFPAW